jgi:hypothetical protein
MEGQLPIDITFHGAEDGIARLRTAGGHEFRLAETHLPPQSAPGDAIRLDLRRFAGMADAERMPLGMALLNEILRAT